MAKPYDIPWPTAGLNTNVSESLIATNEAYKLQNVIVNGDSDVRRRNGTSVHYGDIGQLMSSANSDAIMSVRYYDNNIVVGLLRNADRGSGYTSRYYTPHAITVTNGTTRSLYSEGGGTFATSSAGELTSYRSIGRSVNFLNSNYAASWDDFNDTYTLYGDSLEGPRIIQWAGADGANVTGTTAADITVGATSCVLSSTPATDITGFIATVDLGSGVDQDYRTYNYVVDSYDATDVFFKEPWGQGDPAAATLASGATIKFRSQHHIQQAPTGVSCTEVYRGRLFAGRGYIYSNNTSPRFYSNAVSWSYPGNPQKWPSNNYFILDTPDTDQIMGMVAVPEGLLIFTLTQTFILTGYDEASFNLSNVSSRVGCLHSASITAIDGGAVWVGESGVYIWNGGITDISEPKAARGISTSIKSELTTSGTSIYGQSMAISKPIQSTMWHDGRIFVHINSLYTDQENDVWIFDTVTGSWSTFTIGDSDTTGETPIVLQFVAKFDTDAYVVTAHAFQALTDCYSNEVSEAGNFDLYMTSAGDTGVYVIPSRIEMVVNPAGHDTVRMRELEAFHSCRTTSGSQQPVWQVEVIPNISSGTPSVVGEVRARSAADVTDFSYVYSDRFTLTTSPNEGHLFSVRMYTDGSSLSAASSRLHKLRLYLDPQIVRQGWVDPTAEAQ